MGYILPISQYEYTNYHVRDIKDKKQTQNVTKPYKVLLIAEEKKMCTNKYRHLHTPSNHKKRQTGSNYPTEAKQINSVQYARLTGKGGIINEMI